MAHHGKMDVFNPDTEPWTHYCERYDIFVVVNKITDADEIKMLFLNVIGPQTYNKLRDLARPTSPLTMTLDEIKNTLSSFYQPKTSEITERFNFNNRARKQGETVTMFTSALKKLAESCNYGQMQNDLIRDRFVCGIQNDHMQTRLLSEDTLTLDSAIEIATSMETAVQNVRDLKHYMEIPDTTDHSVNLMNSNAGNFSKRGMQPPSSYSRNRFPQGPRQPCIRCTATDHEANQCPHLMAICFKCNRQGHISRACLSNTQVQSQRSSHNSTRFTTGRTPTGQQQHLRRRQQINRLTHDLTWEQQEALQVAQTFHEPLDATADGQYIAHLTAWNPPATKNHENSASFPDYPVFHMQANQISNSSSTIPPCLIICRVNDHDISMEADSGSLYSLISEATFHNICGAQPLQSFPGIISSFSGHHVDIAGQAQVSVTYNDKTASLPVLIFRGPGPNLCGRQWLFSDLAILRFSVDNMSTTPTLDHVLEKHASVFTPGIGCLKGFEVKLYAKLDGHPRFFKPRTVPYALKTKVEEELDRLQHEGIISAIPYAQSAAPIVPVMKPSGKIRICGDFKMTTNQIIDTEKYPLPRANDIFATLAGCVVFSRLDMSDAYNQLCLDEDSKNLVVINTSKGLFRYNRLPFGITSASAIFQRQMETLLRNVPGVAPFQDDILLGGTSIETHLIQLGAILTLFKNAGLKLRREKCQFLRPSLDFLGHRLDRHGLHPQPDKMEAIESAPSPTSLAELRSFLGLLNYYNRFLPQNSTNLAPLYDLTKNNVPFIWTTVHEQAFLHAKSSLRQSNILAHFDPAKDVYLACDASPVGVGAVISHITNGMETPIAFASRTLSQAEKGYPQIEREALSIIFGVQKFRDYLLGRKFHIITDHQPLLYLFSANKPIPTTAAVRIQSWALKLSGYNYVIHYKKGAHHANADALSRLPLPYTSASTPAPTEQVLLLASFTDGAVTCADMRQATTHDPTLQKLLHFIATGWPNNKPTDPALSPYFEHRHDYTTEQGIILLQNKVVVPSSLRPTLLAELHSSHQGMVPMKQLARTKIWWPGLSHDIDNMARCCTICQSSASMPPKSYRPWPTTNTTWSRVHMDFAGPIEGQYLLISVDSHSKWLEVDITKTTSTEMVTAALRQHISRFGIMHTLVTDNATCFASMEFQEFTRLNGITHMTTAPYHPASNGMAERSVRTVKSTLKKINGGTSEGVEILNRGLDLFRVGKLETRLARLLLNYRRTPLANGLSPAEVMLGRKITTRLDTFRPHPSSNNGCASGTLTLVTQHPSAPSTTPSQDIRNDQPQVVRSNTNPRSSQDIRVSSHKSSPRYQGDKIMYRNYARGNRWGPGHIVRPIGSQMFLVDTPAGHMRRHRNQLRFTPPNHNYSKGRIPGQIIQQPEPIPSFVFPHTPPMPAHTPATIVVTPATQPTAIQSPPDSTPPRRSNPYYRHSVAPKSSLPQHLASGIGPAEEGPSLIHSRRHSTRLKKPPSRLTY